MYMHIHNAELQNVILTPATTTGLGMEGREGTEEGREGKGKEEGCLKKTYAGDTQSRI